MRLPGLLLTVAAEIVLGMFLLPGSFAASEARLPSELSGMVWQRHGDWHLNGSPAVLRLGEAIPAGGLLTAGAAATNAIEILLPDGQRMLCECYDAKACSQGFRVPGITPRPSPTVWEMFVAVRNVLLLRPATANSAFPNPAGRAAMAANVEIVAAVSPEGDISIAPALRVLPAGHYQLAVASDGQQAGALTASSTQPLEWGAAQKAALVRVGGPGVYRIRVSDHAFVPRIEIEVLATPTASLGSEAEGLKQARDTVIEWNRTHPGWSLHEFLRVYLESRVR